MEGFRNKIILWRERKWKERIIFGWTCAGEIIMGIGIAFLPKIVFIPEFSPPKKKLER